MEVMSDSRDRAPERTMTEVITIKIIPRKRNAKGAKWLSEKALLAKKRREAEGKEGKDTQMQDSRK